MFFGIVCIDIYGYYPTLGLYSAGKSMHYVTPLLLTLFLSLILPLSHTTLNSAIHSKFETAKVYFIQLEWAHYRLFHIFDPHTNTTYMVI